MIKNYLVLGIFLSFINVEVNAAVIKSIDFESETIGTLPSTSSTDTSKINNINFGDPLIAGDSANKYLEFDPSQGYDQVQVGTYAYEPSVRFSYDMFLADNSVAVLFFDNPTIQRFEFTNGSIKAYNVDPSSRLPGTPVTYSNTYINTFDISSYDLTQWTNFIFDIDYATELVDVYINNTMAFSASIFSQQSGTNSVRFQAYTNQGVYGVDNLLLETNPGALLGSNSVPESTSIYLLASGLLGLFGVARRKV